MTKRSRARARTHPTAPSERDHDRQAHLHLLHGSARHAQHAVRDALKVLRDNCTRQEKGDFPMAAMKQMAEELAAAGYGEVRTTARGGMEYRYLIPKGGSGGQ